MLVYLFHLYVFLCLFLTPARKAQIVPTYETQHIQNQIHCLLPIHPSCVLQDPLTNPMFLTPYIQSFTMVSSLDIYPKYCPNTASHPEPPLHASPSDTPLPKMQLFTPLLRKCPWLLISCLIQTKFLNKACESLYLLAPFNFNFFRFLPLHGVPPALHTLLHLCNSTHVLGYILPLMLDCTVFEAWDISYLSLHPPYFIQCALFGEEYLIRSPWEG